MPVVTPGGYGRFVEQPTSPSDFNSSSSYGGIQRNAGFPFSNDGPAAPVPETGVNFNDTSSYTGKTKSAINTSFSDIRRENAGLNKGGVNSPKERAADPQVNSGVTSTSLIPAEDDWRIRISLPTSSSIFYQNPGASQLTMQPIIDSGVNGVIFPYTPQITVAHNARYQEQSLTHANFKNYFYEGSDVAAITISGDFTAQNEKEAAYVLACVYFLRACTRMWFGQTASLPVGTPPTIVFLDGYGQFYFPHVSCVITNFSHTLPGDVDYIPLKNLYQNTRIPTMSQISVTLQPVYSRKRMHEDFNLDHMAQGLLLGSKKGVGGFL